MRIVRKLIKPILLLLLIALVIGGTSLYFLVKNKQLLLNPLFVSLEKDMVGADISHYQGEVDMSQLRAQNVRFVYLKATEGSIYQDAFFPDNWQRAKEQDMPAGAYHFFSFDSTGQSQADHFIEVVGDLNKRLIPVVDLELYGDYQQKIPASDYVVRELGSFLGVLESRYGVKPMIYTTTETYKRYIEGSFDSYPLWISSLMVPVDWVFHKDWMIWQYTDRAKLTGFNDEYIDLNVLKNGKSLSDITVR